MIWMLLLGALPMDPIGDPLPRYLTPIQVTHELAQLVDSFQQCAPSDEHTDGLSFAIEGNGRVQNIMWSQPEHVTQRCWQIALEKHHFSNHDDEPVRVNTTVYVRAGIVTLSPQPTVHTRDLGPLMMFVLPRNLGRVTGYLHGERDPQEER